MFTKRNLCSKIPLSKLQVRYRVLYLIALPFCLTSSNCRSKKFKIDPKSSMHHKITAPASKESSSNCNEPEKKIGTPIIEQDPKGAAGMLQEEKGEGEEGEADPTGDQGEVAAEADPTGGQRGVENVEVEDLENAGFQNFFASFLDLLDAELNPCPKESDQGNS